MDFNTLGNATLQELSKFVYATNQQDRQSAESNLLSEFPKQNEHYVSILVSIFTNESLPAEGQQAAAATLRRIVQRNWESKEEKEARFKMPVSTFPEWSVSANAKPTVRESLLKAMINCPKAPKKLVEEIFRNIADLDFPQNWPQLIGSLETLLKTPDMPTVLGASRALLIALRNYESSTGSNRKPLLALAHATLPQLLLLFQSAISQNSEESGNLQVSILKCFSTICHEGLPNALIQDHEKTLSPWIGLIFTILSSPLPENQEKNNIWWKAKKWASHIAGKLFRRYCDPSILRSNTEKKFCTIFSPIYAPKLLEAVLGILYKHSQGTFLPDMVLYNTLQYCCEAVKNPVGYKILQKEINWLFPEVAFPLLSFSQKDAELWQEDPLEFLRREFDIIEEYSTPKSVATNFLNLICKKRSKHHLNDIMQFLSQVLTSYQGATDKTSLAPSKEAALYIIGNLSSKLLVTEMYESALEPMLIAHVFPEFESPLGFMRARAVWTFCQFFDLHFNDPQVFVTGTQYCIKALADSELPVRVQAASTLKYLCHAEAGHQLFASSLEFILSKFIALILEVPNEEIVDGLHNIMEVYGEQMAPHALLFCKSLSQTFITLAQGEMINMENRSALDMVQEFIGTKGSPAAGVLSCLECLLDELRSNKEVYDQLEPILLEVLQVSLDPKAYDFYADSCKIFSYITYFGTKINPAYWSLYIKIVNILSASGFDLLQEALNPIDNLISRDTEFFLTQTINDANLFNTTMNVWTKAIADNDSEIVETSGQLIEVILLNCRGKIDQYIPLIVQLTTQQFGKEDLDEIALTSLILTIANCLYYDARITYTALESGQATATVFKKWSEVMYFFSSIHQKKVAILGLSTAFTLPINEVPQVVKMGLTGILEGLVSLVHGAYTQKKKQDAKRLEGKQAEEGVGRETSYLSENEDIDSDHEGEKFQGISMSRDQLEKLAQRAQNYGEAYSDDDDDEIVLGMANQDSEDEEEEEFSDSDLVFENTEEIFSSPLDDLDEVIYFAEIWTSFQQNNQQLAAQLTSGISQVSMQLFSQLPSISQERQQLRLQEQQNQNRN